MELIPPVQPFSLQKTHRLIPSRFPSVGILDQVTSPEDLSAIVELESWTNDRISNESGIICRIPHREWVVGIPNATIVMAAFCHPQPEGSRFNDGSLGAWYAALSIKTAHAEVLHHRRLELAEVGVTKTSFTMREYISEFQCDFHSLLSDHREFERYYNPGSYTDSQDLGQHLRDLGSNGIVYRSVRDPMGTCVVCFRPRQVLNVRQGAHFEYILFGSGSPHIRRLSGKNVS